MTEFNPYYKWLGISKDEDSPSHYQMLGLNRGEFDPDVIEAAAEQRILFLESVQNGANKDLARKLTKEIRLAKLTLLDPKKREAHDIELRRDAGMPFLVQPSSAVQTQTGAISHEGPMPPSVSKPPSVSTPPTVSTPPRYNYSPSKNDHPDPPQKTPVADDNLLPRPSHSPAPAPPLPQHLINAVISQTPNSQTLGGSSSEGSSSTSRRDSPKGTIDSDTESIVVSGGKRRNFSSARANRSKTKRNQKKFLAQVAMFFVPTLLIIILVTIFPKSFESLIHGIRGMVYSKDSVASPK